MIDGNLFTRDFLIEGIQGTEAWSACDDTLAQPVWNRIAVLLSAFQGTRDPNEAETEKDLIWPVLEALGWSEMSVQPNLSVKARDDVPDALLFADAAAKARAVALRPWQRFGHGLCIVEAKRWNRVLDREETRQQTEQGVPATQMLRYLRRVDDITQGGLRWGILTNGRQWRLYFSGALSVADDFLELDLGEIFGLPGEPGLLDRRPDSFPDQSAWRAHSFRLFLLLFRRTAFLPDLRGGTFHEVALRAGKQWEERVADDLSAVVFEEVFPSLSQALVAADGESSETLNEAALENVRQGALILLYRLLFVLYAEDRNLLPDESGPYADYSLTRLRTEIAEKKARGGSFSTTMKSYWSRLQGVFQAIRGGDDGLGIPEYNGGLFEASLAPILARVQLSDSTVAEIVFRLSHIDIGDGRPRYINYRDLSVQQLGSVYERILEHGLRVDSGRVVVAEDPAARKISGSYYTPEELVSLIVERAVGPAVIERRDQFARKATALSNDRRSREVRVQELLPLDPATRLLNLKVCDPAMGSGHFLVSLVDWLTDEVLDAMDEASKVVSFAEYTSPLSGRIAEIRGKILHRAKTHAWRVADSQLDDRHIVRRMVLKRVVYGVDKNPMAVELAKVALWLHSFTVGAPLSFLNHHLRCGDSILGEWAAPTVEALSERGALFNQNAITRVENIASLMESIEDKTDSDIAEVAASKDEFGVVEQETAPVGALFSLLTAERLIGIFQRAPKKAPPSPEKMAGKSEQQLKKWREQVRAFEEGAAFALGLEGAFGDPIRIATGEHRIASPEQVDQLALVASDERGAQSTLFPRISIDERRRVLADRLVTDARALAAAHGFFHWEIGFPNVWSELLSVTPEGGFDAVIGNPPYVRQHFLGEELKRALAERYAVYDGMADLYVYFYEQALRLLKPGGRLSYVVTNKWLRADYAEKLRDFLSTEGQLEFIADFGHAKHFFPDADVFPSVVVIRRPDPAKAPVSETGVCVIPRDAVPEKGLMAAVEAATYPLPLTHFTKESWMLEPPDVMALLEKIKRNSIPLAEYAGVESFRGVTTGFNKAFFIDTATRDALVKDDPACSSIIKSFLRGQDVKRWYSPWAGLWMIFTRRGIDINQYPSVKRHLEQYRRDLEPKPNGWAASFAGEKWPGRKEGTYAWYEIQDSVEYWPEFNRPKIIYQAIQFYGTYARDTSGLFLSNKAFFLPTSSASLLAVLNSVLGWWISWRHFVHMKDEALSNDGVKIAKFPIPVGLQPDAHFEEAVSQIEERMRAIRMACDSIGDWLGHEFGVNELGRGLADPHVFDDDGFVSAVRAALPKSRKLSAAEISRLKQEYTETLLPARAAAAEILSAERNVSNAVNDAYGLTPDEVALMWRTAPPRMPFDPSAELYRRG